MNKAELKSFIRSLRPKNKKNAANAIFKYFDNFINGQAEAGRNYKDYLIQMVKGPAARKDKNNHLNNNPQHDYSDEFKASSVADALHRLFLACDPTVLDRFKRSISYDGESIFVRSGTTKSSRNRLKYYQLCKAISSSNYEHNISGLVVERRELQLRSRPETTRYKDLFKDLPQFIDEDRLLKKSVFDASFTETDRRTIAWYKDQAMLLEAYQKSRGDPALQQRLALVMLNSYSKASHATDHQNDYREYFENPIFHAYHKGAVYFRESGGNEMLETCALGLEQKLGIDDGQIQFIHNKSFSDVIRRAFPFDDVPLAIDNLEDFENTCEAILDKVVRPQNAILPNNLFALDISEWVKDPEDPEEIDGNLYDFFKEIEAKAGGEDDGVAKDEFLSDNDNKIKLIRQISDQLELYFLKLVKEKYDTDKGDWDDGEKKIVITNIGILFESVCVVACTSYMPMRLIDDSLSQALEDANPPEIIPSVRCPRKKKEGVYNKVKPYLEVIEINTQEEATPAPQFVFTPYFLPERSVQKQKLDVIYAPQTVDEAILEDIKIKAKELYKHMYHFEEHDGYNHEKTKCFFEMVSHTIVNTGYRPNPSHSNEMWMGVDGLDNVLAAGNVKIAQFATVGTVPKVCKSFSEFINHPVVKKFKDLKSFRPTVISEQVPDGEEEAVLVRSEGESTSHKYPYLNVYPEAMVALLEGLKEYEYETKDQVIKLRAHIKETDSEHAFTGTGKIEFGNDSPCIKKVYNAPECREEDIREEDDLSAEELREGFEFYVKFKSDEQSDPIAEYDPLTIALDDIEGLDEEIDLDEFPGLEDELSSTYDIKLTLTLSELDNEETDVQDGSVTVTYTRVKINELEIEKNSTLQFKGLDVDMLMGTKGLNDLLQTIYYRLLGAMGKAIFERENFLEFLKQIELIHQETSALLTLLMPYKTIDFPKAILKAMCEGTIDTYPSDESKETSKISPDLITKNEDDVPMIHLRSAAMHCLSSIISSTEEQKGIYEKKDDTHIHLKDKALKICVLEDCYYEESAAVSDWKLYSKVMFKSDYMSLEAEGIVIKSSDDETDCEPNLGEIILCDDEQEPRQKSAEDTKILKCDGERDQLYEVSEDGDTRRLVPFKPNPEVLPIDIFICDFHHNISGFRTHYMPEDLISHVKLLYRNQMVADQFTVALDNTINFICAKDVKDFTDDEFIKGRIDAGELNLAIFRSGQKFEQLGMDNYYGGYSITLNKKEDWEKFNERMNLTEDELQGVNRQAHTHLSQHAAKWQDMYRYLIMKNTKFLLDRVPKGIMNGAQRLITKTDDPYCVFLDIRKSDSAPRDRRRETKQWDSVKAKIPLFVRAHNMDFTIRPSFGFATTNQVDIFPGLNFRMTIGLGGEATMLKWVDFFSGVYHWRWGKYEYESLPSPCTPSDNAYVEHMESLYGSLPAKIKPDSELNTPMKISRVADQNDRNVIFEVRFPPRDGATEEDELASEIVLKLRFALKRKLHQFMSSKNITCSARALSTVYERSLEIPEESEAKFAVFRMTPGFENQVIDPRMPSITPTEAIGFWSDFFEKLDLHLSALVGTEFGNLNGESDFEEYYGSVEEALKSFPTP